MKALTNREQFGPAISADTWRLMFYAPRVGVDAETEVSWNVCKSALQALGPWGVAEGTLLLNYLRHVLMPKSDLEFDLQCRPASFW